MAWTIVCVVVFVLTSSEGLSGQISSEQSRLSSLDVVKRADAEEAMHDTDVTCPRPEIPEHATIKGEGVHVGSVLQLACRDGYKLVGHSILTCVEVEESYGRWEPVEERLCVADQHPAQPASVKEVSDSSSSSSLQQQTQQIKHQERNVLSNPPSYSQRNQAASSRKAGNIVWEKRKEETYVRKEKPFIRQEKKEEIPSIRQEKKEEIPSIRQEKKEEIPSIRQENKEETEPRETMLEKTRELLSPHCGMEPIAGPCQAYFKRYYFNTQTMECHTFIYGGCKGNDNNFQTMKDCNLSCLGHE